MEYLSYLYAIFVSYFYPGHHLPSLYEKDQSEHYLMVVIHINGFIFDSTIKRKQGINLTK